MVVYCIVYRSVEGIRGVGRIDALATQTKLGRGMSVLRELLVEVEAEAKQKQKREYVALNCDAAPLFSAF